MSITRAGMLRGRLRGCHSHPYLVEWGRWESLGSPCQPSSWGSRPLLPVYPTSFLPAGRAVSRLRFPCRSQGCRFLSLGSPGCHVESSRTCVLGLSWRLSETEQRCLARGWAYSKRSVNAAAWPLLPDPRPAVSCSLQGGGLALSEGAFSQLPSVT